MFAQVIVSSPGSPSSEESEASPEPINKGLLGGLGYEKNDETTTTTTTTSSTSGGIGIGVGIGAGAGVGVEQVTPTSSVDTEEGNPQHPEEGEKGVEGDVEASDDDRHQHIPKTH